MALPSSRFTAIATGVLGVVVIGAVAFNQTTKETYSPSLSDDGVQVVSDGEVLAKCTATGGNIKVAGGAKYDTCIISPQLTTTGSIQSVSLEVAASPLAVGMDCGFVKAAASGTGTAFLNLNNLVTGTGSKYVFGTGSLRWNSADYIKCGTLTNPTSLFNAALRVRYSDDYSE